MAKRGQPTKYDPSWPAKLPDMFKLGQSIVEVATELGISVASYYNYEQAHPDFLEASTRGRQLSQAWWERQGRENLFDVDEYDGETKQSRKKRFNEKLWGRNMGARFKDWREKVEVETSDITIKHVFDPEGL